MWKTTVNEMNFACRNPTTIALHAEVVTRDGEFVVHCNYWLDKMVMVFLLMKWKFYKIWLKDMKKVRNYH